jgi:hypothetical protein
MEGNNALTLAKNEFKELLGDLTSKYSDALGKKSEELEDIFERIIEGVTRSSHVEMIPLNEFGMAIFEMYEATSQVRLILAEKLLEILQNHFKKYFDNNRREILLIIYDTVGDTYVKSKLLLLLSRENPKSLPYPGYVIIQISEIERILTLGEEEYYDEIQGLLIELE